GLPASLRAFCIRSTVSFGMPWSAPPYSPSTGACSEETRSMGCFGCSGSAGRTSGPYQATPAFQFGLWAAYSQAIRPPQQNPVMPSLAVSALPVDFAQATAASRSDMTCSSGTLETTLLMISWMSVILDTSPCRAYNSGATAK